MVASSSKFVRSVVVVALLAALVVNMRMLQSRSSKGDGEQAAVEVQNVPPTLALTTMALGPLRGLIVDGLWWRMIQHQDEGRFFETIQLTKWITALQPRFEQVWAFSAWNLAYNVAYEFPDPEMRWKWTVRAIELLRDDGLRYCPDSAIVRGELVRLFLDRIGTRVDAGQETFRQRWAADMMRFLPKGNQPELLMLREALRSKDKLFEEEAVRELLNAARVRQMDFSNAERVMWLVKNRSEDVETLLDSPSRRAVFARLYVWVRASELERVMKINLDHAIFVDREYGPFDWRLSQAHAVYWAVSGEVSFQEWLTQQDGQRQIMVRQAMEQSFDQGRFIYDPKSGYSGMTNNLAIVGKIHDCYDHLMDHSFSPTVDQLHKAFLERAAVILYSFNRRSAARMLYGHYKEDYSTGRKGLTFERFIAENMHRALEGGASGSEKTMVESALFQAYLGVALGDRDRALGYANLANLAWERNRKTRAEDSPKRLPPFAEMKKSVLQQLLAVGVNPAMAGRLQEKEASLEADGEEVGEPKGYLGDSVEGGKASGHARKRDVNSPQSSQR